MCDPFLAYAEGAYIFRPKGEASPLTTTPPTLSVYHGVYVQEVLQVIDGGGG
jgi:hypothetical protein